LSTPTERINRPTLSCASPGACLWDCSYQGLYRFCRAKTATGFMPGLHATDRDGSERQIFVFSLAKTFNRDSCQSENSMKDNDPEQVPYSLQKEIAIVC
jgi:hypothetical protein